MRIFTWCFNIISIVQGLFAIRFIKKLLNNSKTQYYYKLYRYREKRGMKEQRISIVSHIWMTMKY